MVPPCQAAPCKKIFDLANANHFFATVFQHIQQRGSHRWQREVAPVLGACEISRRAGKWARNHAPHGMLPSQHTSGNPAHIIQFFERYHILVCCELEDAIRGSVQDRTTGAQVFFAQFLDDFSARSSLIAQHLASDSLLELLYKTGRKPMWIGGKRLSDARCWAIRLLRALKSSRNWAKNTCAPVVLSCTLPRIASSNSQHTRM